MKLVQVTQTYHDNEDTQFYSQKRQGVNNTPYPYQGRFTLIKSSSVHLTENAEEKVVRADLPSLSITLVFIKDSVLRRGTNKTQLCVRRHGFNIDLKNVYEKS